MNDVTQTKLKVVVEQAVRPIQATMARKRQMREELLSHLVATFEEEFERTGDQQAALDRAKQRFGKPGELTTQLQQAVPRWDRCRSILENMGCKPDESAWHLAAKHFLAMLILYSAPMLALTIMLFVGKLPSMGAMEVQRIVAKAFLLGLPVLAGFNVILSLILASLLNKIGPVLAPERWGRILLVAMCVLLVPCGLVLYPFAGAALLFILMAHQTVTQWRYQEEWI